MENLFSERNGLVNCIVNDYPESFRSSIVTSFYNQYNTLEKGELFGRLQDVMDLFGIKQCPQVNDMATLLYNKEHTLEFFMDCPWFRLFDFVEYVLTLDPQRSKSLTDKYNLIFRMQGCKYRLINGKVLPVMNDFEIREISQAMNTKIDAVDAAYNEAVSLFSDRQAPDYNAIISKASNALESMVLTIAKEHDVSADTLGRAINGLESKDIFIDEDMRVLIKGIYRYACNAGIRHGGTEPITANEEDAILILVLSAAAINYLSRLYKS